MRNEAASLYFLDACVPIYAGGREHRYRESCARIVIGAARGELAVVTDAEVIQELAYHFRGLHLMSKGLKMAEELLEFVEAVLPVTRKEAARSLELLRAYPFLLPRDAVHIAVMESAGLTRIVTADRHFDRVVGIERVDPADLTW